MNKKTYDIIKKLPIIGGLSFEIEHNFFALNCSPFMEHFMEEYDQDVFTKWFEEHPNRIMSPEVAELLMKIAKK